MANLLHVRGGTMRADSDLELAVDAVTASGTRASASLRRGRCHGGESKNIPTHVDEAI